MFLLRVDWPIEREPGAPLAKVFLNRYDERELLDCPHTFRSSAVRFSEWTVFATRDSGRSD